MVERPLPGKTLVGYQDKRKKLLTTLLQQKAVSRNRQGGNGFFVVSVLTIIRQTVQMLLMLRPL